MVQMKPVALSLSLLVMFGGCNSEQPPPDGEKRLGNAEHTIQELTASRDELARRIKTLESQETTSAGSWIEWYISVSFGSGGKMTATAVAEGAFDTKEQCAASAAQSQIDAPAPVITTSPQSVAPPAQPEASPFPPGFVVSRTAPAGYAWTDDTHTVLSPIPGGPADNRQTTNTTNKYVCLPKGTQPRYHD